jgi:predicted nucleotidyltransferase
MSASPRPRRVDERQLDAIVEYVTRVVGDPRRIVLFGSAVRGGMHEHSDLDVAVLVATPDDRRDAVRALHCPEDGTLPDVAFPVEFVVGDELTWARSRGEFGSLAHEVLSTGRELYVA